MPEILSSSKSKSTLLKTSLNEEMFAKTKFSNLLDETGVLAEKLDENKFVFSPWKFSGTKSDESDVYFEGGGFEGETVSSILIKANDGTKEDEKKAEKALSFLAEVYTYALSGKNNSKIDIPCSGVYGILYGLSGEKEAILFVPEKTFDKCAANLGKEDYNIMQEPWRDSALKGKDALSFSRAVTCYFALTKKLPYPPKIEDKSSDISYRNFVPLEYELNGVDEKLASAVNKNLSGKAEMFLFLFPNSKKNFLRLKNAFRKKARKNSKKRGMLLWQKKQKVFLQ